jgi:hypothetical protein
LDQSYRPYDSAVLEATQKRIKMDMEAAEVVRFAPWRNQIAPRIITKFVEPNRTKRSTVIGVERINLELICPMVDVSIDFVYRVNVLQTRFLITEDRSVSLRRAFMAEPSFIL